MRVGGFDLRRVPADPGLRRRALAAVALLRTERDEAYPGVVIESVSTRLGWTDRSDRAGATDLAQGVLRWRGPIDALLGSFLADGVDSVEPLARQVLRAAAYEIAGPDGAAPHAAVHAAVEIVKRARGPALAGLANAVLRRVAERFPPGRGLAPEDAARDALPAWLRARLAAAWGEDACGALAGWSLAEPVRTLRANRRRGDPREALDAFPGASWSPWSPWCLRLPPGAGDLRAHPLVVAGKVSIQEEGAFLVAEAIPLAPGLRILDACAGRGNKTAALAERAGEGAIIVAADSNARKVRHVPAEFERLGLAAPRLLEIDWAAPGSSGAPGGPFDLVLVDAPCSGTGTVSRRPEIRWRLREPDVEALCGVQERILARTADLLAPGGTLVYAVCSLLAEEGDARVAGLLSARPDLEPLAAWPPPPFRRSGHGAVLLPHESGTDGFFVAALRRGS